MSHEFDADFWGESPETVVEDVTGLVEVPRPPSSLLSRGRRLFESVVDGYELAQHELDVLIEAARTVDMVDKLERLIRNEGPVIDSPQGKKTHPALTEVRQQRIVFARLIAALRIPLNDEQEVGRLPQQRTGVRTVRGA